MLGKFFECEANRKEKYYRVIRTTTEYSDCRTFQIDKIVISDRKVNLNANEQKDIGGFCVSTYEYIFRWLIRGDTLCEVTIPEKEKVYKTTNKNGVYVADKIILSNPIKIDDNLAMKLYMESNLSEESYFKAMTACAICGYVNTAMKVCMDKVNEENVEFAISELENFCNIKNEKEYINDFSSMESVRILYDKLEKRRNNLDKSYKCGDI